MTYIEKAYRTMTDTDIKEYVDNARSLRVVRAFNGDLDIFHYDTYIFNFNVTTGQINNGFGYSRTDCNIINSFMVLADMPYRAHINKGRLIIVRE